VQNTTKDGPSTKNIENNTNVNQNKEEP